MPSVRDNPAIAAAWARGRVRQLEDRYAAGLGDRSALEQTIIATSLRFGVLCRFTAYVAVDRAAVVNEGGEVHQITQPVEMPAGWREATAFSAACYAAPEALRIEDVRLGVSHRGLGYFVHGNEHRSWNGDPRFKRRIFNQTFHRSTTRFASPPLDSR